VRLIDSAPITLTVVGFDLSGIAACNDYDFTADFGDGSVDIVTGSVTSMGCLADGVTELEQLYLSSIGPSASYVVDDTTLTWQSPTATWVFTRVPATPASPLVGTTWVLNGVINEFGGMSAAGIDAAFIVFADDGTLHGSTGCRDLTGTWTLNGDIVTTKEVTVEGACTGTLTDVDKVVVQVLNEGFAGAIDGDHLGAHPRDNLGLDYFAAE
jgi:heat shock protein HslJ